MAANIDFDFIAKMEGGTQSKAYVPVCTDKSVKNPKNKVCYLKPTGSVIANSGVTIGAGFDLGQQNESGLKAMGISQPLIEKFKPYLQKHKQEALDLFNKSARENNLLMLSPSELRELTEKSKTKFLTDLGKKYDKQAGGNKFLDQPQQAQTSMLSYFYQNGLYAMDNPDNNSGVSQKFWKACLIKDWKNAATILRSAKVYTDRRKAEAAKIEEASS